MFRGFRLIKRYYILAGVKTTALIIQFVFLLLPALLSTLTPILIANTISALTVYDFSKAIYFITLDFLIVLATTLFYFLYHIASRKINKTLFSNFNDYLYENIKKNKNIKTINLPTLTNVSVCIEFNKTFLYKLCFLIKAIFTLGIILYYSDIICISIIAISFISYLFLKITDKKIQTNSKKSSILQQSSLDLLNNIHKGSEIEENYNLNTVLKNKYFSLVGEQIKINNKISFLYNINNNFISLILKTAVFASTIFLVFLIKSTHLTLSVYLILTPYLTSSAQNLISFFELFTEFGNIENILNEFESLQYKEQPDKKEELEITKYNLYLYHVYYKKDSIQLKDINADFLFGKSYLIKSKNKNEIDAMIQIIEKPSRLTAGSIFIENKNASDIKIENYRKIISSTNSEPFFFNISLIENLIMVCHNKKQIIKSIKDFGLKHIIDKLENKENTIIDSAFDKSYLFLFGILRCYLSGSKIICIQNIPPKLNNEIKKLFLNIIKFLNNKNTVIIFDYYNFEFISTNKTFSLENGKLKEI